MSNRMIKENVDIYQMPVNCFSAEENTQLTMGDLHGNAMKLMFMLVKQGIVTNMTKETYEKLVRIYRKSPLIKQDIEDFNQIISGLQLKNKTAIRLIGDELGDRGSNDYFTLKILKKLHDEQVPVEHIISNHCAEFVQSCEDYPKKKHFHAPMLMYGHADSLENLNTLVEQGLVSPTEVLELANVVVKPKLKVISYTLNADASEITLFSHAGIGLNIIEGLAKLLKVPYQDATALELAKTIDSINQGFQDYVKQGAIHKLLPRDAMFEGYQGGSDLRGNPLVCAIWNRRYDLVTRPAVKNDYKISYAHGHDSDDPLQHEQNVFNLDEDNDLGKFISWNRGTYQVLHHTCSPRAEAKKQKEANSLLGLESKREEMLLGPTVLTREAFVIDFQIQLRRLHQKEKELRRHGHIESANVAKELTGKLTESFMNTFPNDVKKFQKECKAAIDVARPNLENHRGWGLFLKYLLLSLSGAGLFIVATDIYHKKATGKHLPFFKTDSAKKVGDIEGTILRAPKEPPNVA